MAVTKMENVTLAFSREELEKVHLNLISSDEFEPIQFKDIVDDEIAGELFQGKSENPYKELYNEMTNFLKITGYKPLFDKRQVKLKENLDVEATIKRFRLMNKGVKSFLEKRNELSKKLKEYKKVLFHVKILANLNVELENLAEFRRVKLLFGRVPLRHYEALVESLLKVPILVLEVNRDESNSWIFVFTTPDFMTEAHKILQSAYFEEDKLPVDYRGTPFEVKERIESLIEITELSIKERDSAIKKVLYASKEFIDGVYSTVLAHKRVYDLANFNDATPGQNLYFISGWMPKDDVEDFGKKLDGKVLMIDKSAESIQKDKKIDVPVKLKNKGFLFQGYELITKMFGTPNYNEIDPTPYVTAFFIFMFGFMLGDIGHGTILFLFGYFMNKKGSKKFGTVMMSAALSSVFFGFMYGSVFGFEDWIPALWLRPILQINQLLVVSIYFGIGMLSFGMILNIINGFRQRNLEKAIFSAQGIAGLVFYWPSIVAVSFYFIRGNIPFNGIMLTVVLIAALIAMFFKKILGQLVSRQKVSLPKGFWVESGFGIFETLISFLSNAISYVRLAAFALMHGALFLAFWVMALMVLPSPGGGVWAIIIFLLGQLILVGLEGLVVFIQDLRLVYYEFFTKFFEASGKDFHPFLFREDDVE